MEQKSRRIFFFFFTFINTYNELWALRLLRKRICQNRKFPYQRLRNRMYVRCAALTPIHFRRKKKVRLNRIISFLNPEKDTADKMTLSSHA